MPEVRLSPTSALVLLWAGREAYRTKSANNYLDAVSLDDGISLRDEYDAMWKHNREVIRNRKAGIRRLCVEFAERVPRTQIVCLGAGLDPLSLELADLFPEARVFDVDLDYMQVKREVVASIEGPSNIAFCTANIASRLELTKSLNDAGWNPQLPTLIVAEGISYFLSRSAFLSSISAVLEKVSQGMLVLESAIPLEQVDEKMRPVPTRALQRLKDDFNLSSFTTYDRADLEDLASTLGGNVASVWTMYDLEKMRLNNNPVFSEPGFGWNYVSMIELKRAA